jgi:hypothetical protein
MLNIFNRKKVIPKELMSECIGMRQLFNCPNCGYNNELTNMYPYYYDKRNKKVVFVFKCTRCDELYETL